MITIDLLRKDLLNVYDKLGKVPGKKLYAKNGQYSPQTICRHFGSWPKALYEVFEFTRPQPVRTIRNCAFCGKPTTNPKFCSRSCSTSESNKTPKRKRQHANNCVVCGTIIPNKRKKCEQCLSYIKTNQGYVDITVLTKKDVLTNDTQRYRRIRNHARIVATKHNLLNCCSICGYDRYVECCHLKPISGFNDNTKILEINDPKNLIGLCPNHHWEFDNGVIL